MNIAVNTRLLLADKLEGIGWFAYETLKRITRAHPEHRFYFIFDRPYDTRFIFDNNVVPTVVYPPTRHPYLMDIYFEYTLPAKLERLSPDLFLSPDGWLPLKGDFPKVNVIHDLNFEHHPEWLKKSYRKYYLTHFPCFAKGADRLATVSEFSKQDIANQYGIALDKIDVVYNGIHDAYFPKTEIEKQKTLQQYTGGYPFFIFVGAIHKRKNLDHIFRAFDILKKTDTHGIKLVVVGEKKWWKGDIAKAYANMQYARDVIFTGHQSPDVLSHLLSASIALLYPSLFEGFGIPIIEAYQAETAVITSHTSAMPEVAGKAALLVDPYSPEDIARAMKQISTDNNLRQECIQQGKIERTRFSWDFTAKKLWTCIEKVMR
ncbi:MAG: glycosyltransferase family 4 protein [Bacteroidales bacterium]|jgi:glycosyltransferase involved in cell wall biosynthesis|nr:glycosyltransferase family 4 protein [Bacteroidales bacterium]